MQSQIVSAQDQNAGSFLGKYEHTSISTSISFADFRRVFVNL